MSSRANRSGRARARARRSLPGSACIVRTGPVEVDEDPPPWACSDRRHRQRSPVPSHPPLDGARDHVDPVDGLVSDRDGQVACEHGARQRVARGRRQGPSDAVRRFGAIGQHPGVTGSPLELRPGRRFLRDRRARQERERCGRDRRGGSDTDGARRSVTAHRKQVGSPLAGAHMLAAVTFPRPDAPTRSGQVKIGTSRIMFCTPIGARSRSGSTYSPSSFAPKCRCGTLAPGGPVPVVPIGWPSRDDLTLANRHRRDP